LLCRFEDGPERTASIDKVDRVLAPGCVFAKCLSRGQRQDCRGWIHTLSDWPFFPGFFTTGEETRGVAVGREGMQRPDRDDGMKEIFGEIGWRTLKTVIRGCEDAETTMESG